jgi:predicted RNA binding protein YcfA (HicA-like mRNA interferase family)
MGKHGKLLWRILRGTSDANIDFGDLCSLLETLGFEERMKGSHHIFRREGVRVLVNLQRDGKKAKPYQVRQVRNVLVKYGLAELSDE